jgi:C4-dicarboxylate-specific signal transduction histidine kinase
MLSPLVVVYVGTDSRGLDVLELLDQHLHRPVHVLTTDVDGLGDVVRDERVDCVVCGPELAAPALQKAVFVVADNGTGEPLFDFSGSVVEAPETLRFRQFGPSTVPEAAATEITSIVLDTVAEGSPDARDPISRGLGRYVAVDETWRVTDWDPRLAKWTGTDPDSVVGEKLWDALPDWDSTVFAEVCREVMVEREATTTDLYHGPVERWLAVRLCPTPTGGIECFCYDISEHKGEDRELEDATEFERTLDQITDAFFTLDNRERFAFLNSEAEFVLDVDADEVEGVRFWDAFPAAVSTTFYEEFKEAMETQEPTTFQEYYRPLDSWFEVTAYPSESGLSVFLRDVTEQVELQQKLQDLHDVTQELLVAESDAEIADRTIEAAETVLDFPMVVAWRYSDSTDLLEPLSWSETVEERVEEMEPLGRDSRFIWGVYQTGDHRHLGFVPATTSNSHHPGRVTSELLVPVGQYGVLGAYSDERDAFDETDVELFRLLASTVEAALARTQRERKIAQRNERLNEFASVVSHDLRNPMNVASAHAELARSVDDDEQHLDKIDESLHRMERLIEDLLARARGERDLEREAVELAATAREAWGGVDTAEASLAVADDASMDADPDRLTQLFENLFRNAIEHAGSDVTVRVGTCADGFYVADNGPGIPEDEREEVFEQGVTSSEDGTGYGLSIVADIVDGHGWSIAATESEHGGARFEITDIYSLSAVSAA